MRNPFKVIRTALDYASRRGLYYSTDSQAHEDLVYLERVYNAFKWLEERHKGTESLHMDGRSTHSIKYWRGPCGNNLLESIEAKIEEEKKK